MGAESSKTIVGISIQINEAQLNDEIPIDPIPIGDDGGEILIRVDLKTGTVVFDARVAPDPSVR
jgi:hypothetical protein